MGGEPKMNTEELSLAFQKKLGKNYAGMVMKWLKTEATYLIEQAEEIAAAKLMLEALPDSASAQDMEYLMRFENPLEIVRDKWIEENGLGTVLDDELTHTLWSITDSGDAEQEYALDPEYTPPEQGGQTLC